MINIFKSKIKCKLCGKNYRLKVERGKRNFICGGYNNKNGCAIRNVISEEFLLDFINRRFKVKTEEELYALIVGKLEKIEIEDKRNFKVVFKDGDFMEMSENKKKIRY